MKTKSDRRLFCFGDLCVDVVARTKNAPKTGQDATVEQLDFLPAGAAVNCAMMAARHGAAAELIGIVGDDPFGQILLDHLAAAGVGTSRITRVKDRTGVVISMVEQSGERTLYSFRGANAAAYPAPQAGLFRGGDCLCVSGYSCQTENSRKTAMDLMTAARAAGAVCALAPSFQFARDVRRQYPEVLKNVDYLFPNREEAALMTGKDAVEDSAAMLHQLGPSTVVVTLGEQGCYVDSRTVQAFVRTERLDNAVDTTGAGDAFCGAFLASLLDDGNLLEAAQTANTAGRNVAARRPA